MPGRLGACVCGRGFRKLPHPLYSHGKSSLSRVTHSVFLFQAQVLAMAGRTKEAEKMTLDIISRESSCIECYRLLSAIYSKRGNYTEVCFFFLCPGFDCHCADVKSHAAGSDNHSQEL